MYAVMGGKHSRSSKRQNSNRVFDSSEVSGSAKSLDPVNELEEIRVPDTTSKKSGFLTVPGLFPGGSTPVIQSTISDLKPAVIYFCISLLSSR